MEKTIKKRMLALITALAVFFGMLPVVGGVAFAEESAYPKAEDIRIGGYGTANCRITANTYYKGTATGVEASTEDDYDFYYDEAEGVLTMNTYVGAGPVECGVDKPITIVVKGDNNINTTQQHNPAISASGGLTILGDGTLSLARTQLCRNPQISAKHVTIAGGVILNIDIAKSQEGILVGSGVTIKDKASVTIKSYAGNVPPHVDPDHPEYNVGRTGIVSMNGEMRFESENPLLIEMPSLPGERSSAILNINTKGRGYVENNINGNISFLGKGKVIIKNMGDGFVHGIYSVNEPGESPRAGTMLFDHADIEIKNCNMDIVNMNKGIESSDIGVVIKNSKINLESDKEIGAIYKNGKKDSRAGIIADFNGMLIENSDILIKAKDGGLETYRTTKGLEIKGNSHISILRTGALQEFNFFSAKDGTIWKFDLSGDGKIELKDEQNKSEGMVGRLYIKLAENTEVEGIKGNAHPNDSNAFSYSNPTAPLVFKAKGPALPPIPQAVQDAVSGCAGEYNKTAQNAVLVDESKTTGYTVEFSDAENGVYSAINPQITNVSDSKDVWVRISKEGHAPFKKKVSAKVTPKALAITDATAANRAYEADKKTVEVESVTFGTEVLEKDTDYTATGNMQDANAGMAKAVTVAVTLKNKNYSLANSNFNTTVDIAKAAAPALADKTINIKKDYRSAQEGNVLLADIMANAPAGAKITAVAPPTSPVVMESVTSDVAKVRYKSKENISATADEVYSITIESTNYENITAKLIFHPTDKLDAAVSFEGELPTNKAYGVAEFTVKAKAANKGEGTGTWTWSDNGAGVISVTGNGDTATVKILKVGTATIKASYASDTTEGSVTSANITVGKATVKVKANDKVIYVNDAIPNLTAVPLSKYYTVTGLVGGDTLVGEAILAYQKDGAVAVPDNTKAGKYDIVISGLTEPNAANYNAVVFEKGSLEIKERPSNSNGNSNSGSSGKSNSGNYTRQTTQSQSANQTKHAVTVKNETAKELVKNITDQMQANHIDKLVENKPMTEKKDAIKALTLDTKAKLVQAVLPKYIDVKTDAWYAKDLAVVMTSGLVKGTGANTVSPAKNVTGQEMMAMLVRTMGKEVNQSQDANWYDAYKVEAKALKLDEGIKFDVAKNLTRAEVAYMIYKYVKLNEKTADTLNPSTLAMAKDMADIPDEYKEAVAYMYQKGILKGYEDGSFRPNRNVSRIEVIALLARVLAM